MVQVGGVDISGSPFPLPVIPSSILRGKPVKTINRLDRPEGIAVCDNGNIVVAEYGEHCVTIVNKEGKKVESFGTRRTKEGQLTSNGQFISPCGVAISNDGHVLLTDEHRLQKLKFDGICVRTVGSIKSGSGQLQFNYPMGIKVHPTTGQIFVADSDNNRIQVFNNNITFSHTITLHGDKTFNDPCDVSLDNKGHLYVAEFDNHCITKLTTAGEYITRFGSKGSTPGQLYNPFSLTINNNLLYVCEYGNHRVSVFDTKGTFLHCFGKRGSGKGEFKQPFAITTDKNGNPYVSDT